MTSPRLCVYCRRRPQDDKWRPFCSERCKLLDLAAWAEGDYRIPGEAPPDAATGIVPDEDREDHD